jgi:hypothetical protein
VVGLTERRRGQKNDALDAFQRAEELRTGTIKTSVFKAPRRFSRLRELSRVHSMLVRDVVRVQGRLKAMYRAREVFRRRARAFTGRVGGRPGGPSFRCLAVGPPRSSTRNTTACGR